MMQQSIAGRYPMRSRLDPAPRRPRPVLAPRRLPVAAIGISAVGHALVALLVVATIMWNGWDRSQVHVVNLVPAIAAVGSPTAPAPSPSLPARPVLALPSRAPAPDPTPEPRERAIREVPRLPEASLPRPSLPPRPGLTRPGEKELPPLAAPTVASRVEKPERVEKPVESRPAPPAARGVPTGSPSGVGALSLDASDFPHAWYLRQVLQKVQGEWQRQNQVNEPSQKPLVFVEIQRDGSIRTPKIEQTSGNPFYDQAALRAIVEASPFPPLPQDWSRPSLRVMFRFDLDRGRG
jgi:TonB family protein